MILSNRARNIIKVRSLRVMAACVVHAVRFGTEDIQLEVGDGSITSMFPSATFSKKETKGSKSG